MEKRGSILGRRHSCQGTGTLQCLMKTIARSKLCVGEMTLETMGKVVRVSGEEGHQLGGYLKSSDGEEQDPPWGQLMG